MFGYSFKPPKFYQNYLAMTNTGDMTDGKPNAVWSQSISSVNAIIHLVALYDIHGRKREVLLVYSVPDTTRGKMDVIKGNLYLHH
jgi:hypothetical protein